MQRLSLMDAFALRRLLSKQSPAGIEVSPPMRLLLASIEDVNFDLQVRRITRALEAYPDIMKYVLMLDPSTPPEPSSRLIPADELVNLTKPDYILTDYPFYTGLMNALVGGSGKGKSFLSLDFNARYASEMEESGHLIYIAAEGLNGYAPRVEAWKSHNGITETPGLYFFKEPVNFMDTNEVEYFMEEIAPLNPRFITVDTVARCMVGADENSAQDMGKFISNVDRVRRYFNCGILLVHHTGTNGKMRGSSSLYAACDAVLFLDRQEAVIVLHNENDKGGKNKYDQELATRYMRLLPVDVTIQGETVQGAVLVPTNKVEFTKEDNLNSNQKLILEVLEGFEDGLAAKAISDAVNLSVASVYRNVKQLQKVNYIIKSGDNFTITPAVLEVLGL